MHVDHSVGQQWEVEKPSEPIIPIVQAPNNENPLNNTFSQIDHAASQRWEEPWLASDEKTFGGGELETVNCQKCNEVLVKQFASDHKCS